MSLFGGGDDSRPASPSQASDFSISTIGEDQGHAARPEGSPDTAAAHDEYNDHDEAGDDGEGVTDRGLGGLQDEGNNISPSAISDGSDVEVRPNRFRGSDRAWLHHTLADRSLAISLDQLKAQDLALHLYSAHHLTARLRNRDAASSSKPWSRKSRWLPSDNQDVQKPWYPESDWTAWPLPPDLAPAGAESFGRPSDGLDSYTLRSAAYPTAADNLREQLHAVMLARAHDDWKARSQTAPDPIRVTTTTTAPVRYSPVRRGRTRSLSAGATSLPSSPSVGDDLPPLSSLDQPIFDQQETNQPDSPADRSIKNEPAKTEDKHFARPVFSADDDRSRALLYPTVNHVMSKLDRLLLALHQSRQTHPYRARDGDTSDSSARSTSRSPSAKSSTKKPKKSSQPQTATRVRRSHRPGPASRPSSPSDLVVFDDSGEDETYEPEKPSRRSRSPSNRASSPESDTQITSPSGKKRRNPPRPGLRDWSEVLGVASLTGWDPAVIEKARQRCRDLFGENMHLYTMAERDGSPDDDETEPINHTSNSRSVQSASWRCPLSNCFRNMQPLEHGFRWREHMRKAHKYDNDQIAKLEEQLVRSGDIAPVLKRHRVLAHNPRGWQPPNPLICPHCPGSEQVFLKVSRLVDHIRRVHKYDPRVEGPPERLLNDAAGQGEDDSSDKSSSSGEDSDGYMVGGVHNDGFLQPVLRHAGSRGKDLEQRAKRANARRSKAELKNAKNSKAKRAADVSR
jgi:hypothetical protein